MDPLRRVVLGLALVCRFLSSAVVVLMMLTICYDVFLRYVFGNPTTWVLELNVIAVLALAFLAVPDLYARDQHIAMDLLHNRLGNTLRRHTAMIVRVAVGVFGLLMTVLGLATTVQTFRAGLLTSGMTPIPMWPIYALIPLGAGLLFLVVLLNPRAASEDRRPDELGETRG